MTKTFEENFPSLKNGEYNYKVKNISENSHNELILVTYSERSIIEYCLDKQNVREAIMRLPDNNRRYILLKELGLRK